MTQRFVDPGYLAPMQAVLDRIRAHAYEALVLTFAVASVVEALAAEQVHNQWLVAVLALGWTLPFAFRARYPLWAPIVACFFLAAFALTAPERSITNLTMPFVAALAAAVSLGLVPDRRLSVAGWAAVIATAAVVDSQSGSAYSDFFWTTLILTLAWFFGSALGTRTQQARELSQRVEVAERDRAAAADRATAEERARIARELHDVVAHSVSVMVVQASGVRRLLKEEQHREREALLSVEQIGRQALTEMRRMLGVMRSGEETPALAPQPGLQHLDRLIAQVEEAGMPVTLRVEGDRPELSPGVDLSAYRIVQEGLTNALKHAKGANAEVVVRYVDSCVELEIADDGPGVGATDGQGHGLVGMRERAAIYGGTLETATRDGGGFVLRAQLPVEGRA